MLLPLFSMLMAIYLGHRGWRYHSTSIGKIYLVLMAALAWWSFAAVMEHFIQGLSAKIFWIKMSYFGITLIPVAWLIFTLLYTKREKWLTRRNLAILFIVPVITLIMVWTNNTFHLMWKDIWLETSISPPGRCCYTQHMVLGSFCLLIFITFCWYSIPSRFIQKIKGYLPKTSGNLIISSTCPMGGQYSFYCWCRSLLSG